MSLSSGIHPAANMVDPLPSCNRRVQMKIWFGNRATRNRPYLYPLSVWTAQSLEEIETLLQRFWRRVMRLSEGWMNTCRELEGVRNWPLQMLLLLLSLLQEIGNTLSRVMYLQGLRGLREKKKGVDPLSLNSGC